MCSVQPLREFIRERLTAAAEEIFSQVEKTIVQYEEEIDRQRRLLDLTWRPRISLQRAGLHQNYVGVKEKVLDDQQLTKQERNTSVEQEEPELLWVKEKQDAFEPSQIKGEPELLQNKEEELKYLLLKEERDEVCIRQDEEQFVLKKETETFMVAPHSRERDHRQPEPNRNQLLCPNLPEPENQDEEGSNDEDSGLSRDEEPTANDVSLHPRDPSDSADSPEEKGPKRSNAEENPFCKICGKCFSPRSRLTRYLKTHTGKKPYACEVCGKRLSRSNLLTHHMRTHTGERPFSCQTCGKGFCTKGNLVSRMRTHAGEV